MADEFGAEELEDGELWLPSDFFSPDEVNHVPNKTFSTCMDGLQRISSSSTFLHRQPLNLCKPPTSLQRFKPAARYGVRGVSGGGASDNYDCGCGAGRSWTGCSPICQVQRLNPVHVQTPILQIEAFLMGERARALQRQLQNRLVLNRVSPRTGHVGTGVFLPRVSSDMANVTKNQNQRFVGKGPRANNSHELHLPPRKMLLNNRRDEHRGYVAAADDVHTPYYWNY